MRTIVVLIFSWIMVLITGAANQITAISPQTLVFLILSGLATGASWLCYFKALKIGDINKVVPIDKSSIVLTMILAFIFLQEEINLYSGIGAVLITVGTFLMIEKKASSSDKNRKRNSTTISTEGTETTVPLKKSYLFYAAGSAVFASLTSILGKIGISGVDSNLGTAIRTGVVLLMSWAMVFITKKQSCLKNISKKELLFIILSGFATGGSWLCYYKALQDGPASVVVPIDKLSILVSIAFSYIVFREKLSKKAALGLAAIVSGTLVMLVPTIFA